MLVGTLIGGSMIGYSAVGMVKELMKNPFREILEATFQAYDLSKIEILKLEKKDWGYDGMIQLPIGLTVDKFQSHLPAIEESTGSKIRFRHIWGRKCSLEFGTTPLSQIIHYKNVEQKGTAIPLATSFGIKYLDLQDGSSCHLCGGGATRMGKTAFQLLVATHLVRSFKGKAKVVIISAKDSDYYMFTDVNNVEVVTPDKSLIHLNQVIQDYEDRKKVIKQKGNINDARTLKERYPSDAFQPVFVIVDEVGVFGKTNNKEQQKYNDLVQDALVEIAERAGYVDIHLIIFSQRPDAKDVLNPRIKTNLLTRIAFTTANEADSNIILGLPDAAKLGGVKGRAILIDGLPVEVQVPYITNEEAEELLKEFVNHDRKRSKNHSIPEEVSSNESGSNLPVNLSRSRKSRRNDQPNLKEIIKGLAH